MDRSGMQNRLSGGKRRLDVYPGGEDEIGHENLKLTRRWMSSQGGDSDSKDHLSQVNQALEFRGMSVDHWTRLQKMEPTAPTTPLNLQQPMNLQHQRPMMRSSIHEMRSVDNSKQAMLPLPSLSQQQLMTPQQSAAHQHSLQHHHHHLHHHQHLVGQQQQQPITSGSQSHHFQQFNSEPMPPHYDGNGNSNMQQMPYGDLSSASRPSSSSIPTPSPLSFRPPPVFAEADLKHSPTSSSSNQYSLQNVVASQSQQPRIHPQGSPLLSDSDEDRFSSILSNQSSILQQSSTGFSGTSSSLVLQDIQAPTAWYSSMRELESHTPSSSRPGMGSMGAGGQSLSQNVNIYSSPTISDLTSQSGLAPLPYQSGQNGTSFRESPVDQDHLLGSGEPQSPLPYGISGSSSSSVVGPKSSSSSLPRFNSSKQPVFQTDIPRRGMSSPMVNGQYSAIGNGQSGPDHLLKQGMMTSGTTSAGTSAGPSSSSGLGCSGGLPNDNCFIQRPPVALKPIRTYTKVYKLGAIGRALDVTRFSNYAELWSELGRMFNLEGQLDQQSGWQLVFQDNENDILLVGDDPWDEFVSSVRAIRILSPAEVQYYKNDTS